MNEGLNRAILLGHIGINPELRYTTNGTAVLNLRLATNESYVDKNKEVQERTDWHAVVFWGTRAEGLAKVLTKGDCICVEGSLRTSSYEKDGVKHYKTEIIGRDLYFTGRKQPPGNGAAAQKAANDIPEPPERSTLKVRTVDVGALDELPF